MDDAGGEGGPACATGDRASVGVLLVHGIGQQRKGDTLTEFGEPLQRWIARWTDPTGDESIVERSRLVTVDPEPAHASIVVPYDRPESDEPSEVRWLLAESWWADAFTTPTYRSSASWTARVAPWIIGLHFGAGTRRAWHRMRRAPRWQRPAFGIVWLFNIFLLILGYLLFTPLLLLVLGLLLVLALVPLDSVRRAVGRAQLLVSRVLGDSYILSASSIQGEAIVSRVRDDLCWLAERSDQVVVVAHSQGAAIAHAVLQGPRPRNVAGLITFGSGLNKLRSIEHARQNQRNLGRRSQVPADWSMALVGIPLVVASIAWAVIKLVNSDTDLDGQIFLAVFGLFFAVGGIVAGVQRPLASASAVRLDDIAWFDYWATSDPVPNGMLQESLDLVSESDGGLPISEPVTNSGSFFRDHSAYWRSDDDFVWRAVAAVAAATGSGIADFAGAHPFDQRRLEIAAARRRYRVRWLLATRVIIVVLIGMAAIFRRSLVDPVDSLSWSPPVWFGTVELALPAGIGAVLAVVALWYGLVYVVWSRWSLLDVEAMRARLPFGAWGTKGVVAWLAGLLLLGVNVGLIAVFDVGTVEVEHPLLLAVFWIAYLGVVAVVAAVWDEHVPNVDRWPGAPSVGSFGWLGVAATLGVLWLATWFAIVDDYDGWALAWVWIGLGLCAVAAGLLVVVYQARFLLGVRARLLPLTMSGPSFTVLAEQVLSQADDRTEAGRIAAATQIAAAAIETADELERLFDEARDRVFADVQLNWFLDRFEGGKGDAALLWTSGRVLLIDGASFARRTLEGRKKHLWLRSSMHVGPQDEAAEHKRHRAFGSEWDLMLEHCKRYMVDGTRVEEMRVDERKLAELIGEAQWLRSSQLAPERAGVEELMCWLPTDREDSLRQRCELYFGEVAPGEQWPTRSTRALKGEVRTIVGTSLRLALHSPRKRSRLSPRRRSWHRSGGRR